MVRYDVRDATLLLTDATILGVAGPKAPAGRLGSLFVINPNVLFHKTAGFADVAALAALVVAELHPIKLPLIAIVCAPLDMKQPVPSFPASLYRLDVIAYPWV